MQHVGPLQMPRPQIQCLILERGISPQQPHRQHHLHTHQHCQQWPSSHHPPSPSLCSLTAGSRPPGPPPPPRLEPTPPPRASGSEAATPAAGGAEQPPRSEPQAERAGMRISCSRDGWAARARQRFPGHAGPSAPTAASEETPPNSLLTPSSAGPRSPRLLGLPKRYLSHSRCPRPQRNTRRGRYPRTGIPPAKLQFTTTPRRPFPKNPSHTNHHPPAPATCQPPRLPQAQFPAPRSRCDPATAIAGMRDRLSIPSNRGDFPIW